MSFIDSLTPKKTEEVKPGLFIQTTRKGYRQVYPAAWDGKINWHNFITGGTWRSLLWFFMLMFLVFAYNNDVAAYKSYYEQVSSDPYAYCQDVQRASEVDCTERLEALGLCVRFTPGLELENIEVLYEDSSSISSNS